MPSIRFVIDLHSYGEDILYSWGDDENQSTDSSMNFQNTSHDGARGVGGDAYREYIKSPDESLAITMASSMAAAIQGVRGRTYLVEPAFQLYPTSGASDDYSFSRHFVDSTKGKVIAYTIEWGSPSNTTPFHPPYLEMQRIIDEITAGLVQFCVDALATVKESFFVIDRSTFGQDEVLALLSLQNPAQIPEAFWVVVDGYTAAELGLNAGNLNAPPIVPAVTLAPGMTAMSVQFIGPVVPEDPTLPPTPQRFRFGFTVQFTSDADFGFAGDFQLVTLGSTLTAVGVTVTAAGLLELIKAANPYLLDGPTSWLSIDLRVFHVQAGQTRFGVTMGAGASDAPAFVQGVMTALTNGSGAAGGETYEGDLPADQANSTLELAPTDAGGTAVFNFCLARVRMRGLTTDAVNARVFFRLFQAQTTNVVFDPTTTYRRFSDGTMGGQAIPLLGVKDGEYVTIPCFARPRFDSASVSLTTQTDPPNVQTILHDPSGNEVLRFYGAWLDINQPGQLVVPDTVSAGNLDGPFAGTLLSVQQAIVRSPHQCLVAEIAFDPVAIPVGVDPSTTDKLAQRNLAWVSIPNPGIDGSRRVPQPFELRRAAAAQGAAAYPDELMIDWGQLPAGSTAQIYLPAVSADALLAEAKARLTTRLLTRVDDHTIGCRAAGVTYVPLPPGAGEDPVGLITVDLPAGIKRGERFDVLVRQVTRTQARLKPPSPPTHPGLLGTLGTGTFGVQPRAAVQPSSARPTLYQWLRVLGSFQVAIPVHTKGILLPLESRQLSILRWIAQAIPGHSRWYPVWQRYLTQLGGRVTGLGGDPGQILPSPTGTGVPGVPGYPGGQPGGPGAPGEPDLGLGKGQTGKSSA